jgi:hypothetical protein
MEGCGKWKKWIRKNGIEPKYTKPHLPGFQTNKTALLLAICSELKCKVDVRFFFFSFILTFLLLSTTAIIFVLKQDHDGISVNIVVSK